MSLDTSYHINQLELLASFLALKSFAYHDSTLDNVTTIAYLNKMGGTPSRLLSSLALEIWNWCIDRKTIIHAEHLPGRFSVRTDWESYHITDLTNWMLHREIFHRLQTKMGPFTINLFICLKDQFPATRVLQLEARPGSLGLSSGCIINLLEGSFALIPRCLHKIREKISALLISPVWSNQTWFPLLLKFLIGCPILLPLIPDIVTNPHGLNHPLAIESHLPLAAWPVSGNLTAQRDFQMELSASFNSPGDHRLNPPIHLPGDSGITGVLHETLIHFQLL